MINEWASPFNPFNSIKILMWRKYIEACLKQEYLIPPMVDIDLSPHCNFKCGHCNAKGIINNKDNNLSLSHYLKLADFLRDWRIEGREERVLSCCISGGGESLTHKGHDKIFQRLYDNNIEVGLITNGSLVTSKDIKIIAETCKWVGFSMDAATPKTYNKIKFADSKLSGTVFNHVCENLKKIAQHYKEIGKTNATCFKFLLTPTNSHEIYEAAKLAKSLGVHDFHLRPVGYLNIVKGENKMPVYSQKMLTNINKQIQEAQKLETDNFKVYGIRHKFTPNFQPILKFKKCRLIPMLPTFGADGYVHTCFDMRGREDLIMCKHFELDKYWNSKQHKKQIDSIDIKQCPRCTFNGYHEAIEQVFIEDKMYRNFL